MRRRVLAWALLACGVAALKAVPSSVAKTSPRRQVRGRGAALRAAAAAAARDPFERVCWSGEVFPARGGGGGSLEAPAAGRAPGYWECVRFAAPALCIYVAGPLMSLIDAAFVGRGAQGEAGLAALGPASTISDSMTVLLVFLSVATTDLVARSGCGAEPGGGDACEVDAAARAATTGLVLAAAFGVGVGASLWAGAGPLCAAYSGNARLAPLSATYVRVRALALPAALAGSVAQAACIGSRDTVTPAVSVAIAAALNFAGDLALVPRFGLAGAAAATALSQYAAAAMLVAKLASKGLVGRASFEGTDGAMRRTPRFQPALESIAGRRPAWDIFELLYLAQMELVFHDS